ncbi:MAG: flagellar basal body rod C-terminal domain-containing protein, partial [Eubacteriales bacterium]
VQKHKEASKKYNELVDKKAPQAQIDAAQEEFVKAAKAEADWQSYTVGLINIRDALRSSKKNLEDASTQIDNSAKAIKDTLAKEGIEAELNYGTQWDYTTAFYKFKRGGNYIKDNQSPPQDIVWKVTGDRKELTREDLENVENGLGIDFKKSGIEKFGKEFEGEFDFEELNCKGALRGSLKMLNENGVFDHGATSDTVRGTGYYEKLLDTLADKLATTLNKLNDRPTTKVKEHLFQKDPNSKVQDRFTAENIRISKDWLEGKYRLTASQEVQPEKDPKKASARNENLLRMISNISDRMGYATGIKMKQNKYGVYLMKDTTDKYNPVADSIDEDGNYVQTATYDAEGKKTSTLVSPHKKIANRDGILYKPDGTLDVSDDKKINTSYSNKLVADKIYTNGQGTIIADNKDDNGYTLSFDPATNPIQQYTPPRWVAGPDGLLYTDEAGRGIANYKDAAGNYIYRTRADGVGDKKIANKDGIAWDDVTNSYSGRKIDISSKKVLTPAYTDSTGKKVIADGMDAQGNYTLRFENGKENKPPKWVADANGEIEYKDGNGNVVANHRDDDGNYVMRTVAADGKVTDKIVANKDGVFYQKELDGSLKKDDSGYIPEGKKIFDNEKPEDLPNWKKSFVYHGSFKEYLTNLGNTLALDISSTKGLVDNHKTVLNDVQNQKDSISKVSIDEEGVNMLLYQKAYNASARLMTALDEAIDKIINGMGVVGR